MRIFKLVMQSFLQTHHSILKNIDLRCMVNCLVSDLINFEISILHQLIVCHLLKVVDFFINSVELDIDLSEFVLDVCDLQVVIVNNLVVICNVKDRGLLRLMQTIYRSLLGCEGNGKFILSRSDHIFYFLVCHELLMIIPNLILKSINFISCIGYATSNMRNREISISIKNWVG